MKDVFEANAGERLRRGNVDGPADLCPAAAELAGLDAEELADTGPPAGWVMGPVGAGVRPGCSCGSPDTYIARDGNGLSLSAQEE